MEKRIRALSEQMQKLEGKVDRVLAMMDVVHGWIQGRLGRRQYDETAAAKRLRKRQEKHAALWSRARNLPENAVDGLDIIGFTPLRNNVVKTLRQVPTLNTWIGMQLLQGHYAAIVALVVSCWNTGTYRAPFVVRYGQTYKFWVRWAVADADLVPADKQKAPMHFADYTMPMAEGNLLVARRRADREWTGVALEKFRSARMWKILTDVVCPVLTELLRDNQSQPAKELLQTLQLDGERIVLKDKPWEPSVYQSGSEIIGLGRYFPRQVGRLAPEIDMLRTAVHVGVNTDFADFCSNNL